MKKFFIMLIGIIMMGAATANAQTRVILRGGFATNNFVGDSYDDIKMNPGYNVGLDFNTYVNGGLYWNTGFMFGSRGYKTEVYDGFGGIVTNKKLDYKFRAHNFQIPLTVGYTYDLGAGVALDGRIGGFFSVDMAGKFSLEDHDEFDTKIKDIDDYNRCDGGLLIGVGVFIDNINIDLAYQRGFANLGDNVEGGASNFLIRLGYAF